MFLYTLLESEHKISKEAVYQIFRDALEIATEFVNEALPNNLPEMNAGMMITYLECQADNLITLLDLPPLYGSKSPFHFMEKINLVNRSNFFERRTTEYAKPSRSDATEFETVEDF
jgi:ribonucleotide reductase beta subunit family protein with ferritin-like domain